MGDHLDNKVEQALFVTKVPISVKKARRDIKKNWKT